MSILLPDHRVSLTWEMYDVCTNCKGKGYTKVNASKHICIVCQGEGIYIHPPYVCMHVCNCKRFADLILFCYNCIENVEAGKQCK